MGQKGRTIALLLTMALTLTSCAFEPGEESSSWIPTSSGQSEQSQVREDYTRLNHTDWTASPHYPYQESNSAYESLWIQAQKDCYRMLTESAFWIGEEADKDGLYPVQIGRASCRERV